MPLIPIIDPAVRALAPDFRALHLFVTGDGAPAIGETGQILAEACRHVLAGGPAWGEAHLAAWADAYSRFGAKPNRTPCSAQALRKRVTRERTLPSISPIVDLYNAISLRYAVPIGGENLTAYAGVPRLVIADGSEPFDTTANGEPVIEHPVSGEVIWRDDVGATCRRWNWRQGIRTRISGGERSMWFVLEALGAMPEQALVEAGEALADGIGALLPRASIALHRGW